MHCQFQKQFINFLTISWITAGVNDMWDFDLRNHIGKSSMHNAAHRSIDSKIYPMLEKWFIIGILRQPGGGGL